MTDVQVDMVKKLIIRETTRIVQRAGTDFAEAIRDGDFNRLVEDVKAGRLARSGATDSECRNLKAKINETGHVAYVIQYSAPAKPRDLPEEIHWVNRPMKTIGYYYEKDTIAERLAMLQKVRRRVEACNYVIESLGIDPQLHGLGTTRFMAEIDEHGKDWRPIDDHWWRSFSKR